ncbi:hypothetical protein HDU76_012135 [Blyttiomyces sp. JEL0837]|nr:hypothetical protein HDU76_012135 [Blyttiomyces sp. JEL0837]
MASSSNKHVTLITGGARGIGAAMAKEVAITIPNSAIVINYRSSSTEADALITELKSLNGVSAIAVQADVGTETGAKQLIESTINTFGHINTLINNAGVYEDSEIAKVTESQYDNVFNSNVKSTILVTSHASNYIVDGGSVINVSSIITHNPFPNATVYAASKGAIDCFTRALAVEFAPRKITVNAIAPGFTKTPMVSEKSYDFAIGITPFKRVGDPEDIAKVVGFLAGDKSRWVTGQYISASGGISYSF